MNYNEYSKIINYLLQKPSDRGHCSLKMLSIFLKSSAVETSSLLLSIKGLGCQITLNSDGSIDIPSCLDVYSQDEIKSALCESETSKIDVFLVIDSTNNYLKSLSLSGEHFSICLAEQQMQGRGRRGKAWVSPFGSNIYLSIRKRVNINPRASGGISLIVGLAIIKAVEGFGFLGLQVKWPNDILVGSKKLAGVLIEVASIKQTSIELVIGVGLNVRMTDTAAQSIDQPWVSLKQLFDKQSEIKMMPSRNEIVVAIIDQINSNLALFERGGLSGFFREWENYDLLLGRQVSVKRENDMAYGTALGLSELGELCVKTESGITYINAGEVSVRLS